MQENYIGQVYAANLIIYFGNGKYILVLKNLFGPEQNILVLAQIWFGPKKDRAVDFCVVHARSRSTMIRVIVNVILVGEFSGTFEKK